MTVIDRTRRTSLGSLDFSTTITDGLVGLFQPRKNAEAAAINHVAPSKPGLIVGEGVAYLVWGAYLSPGGYLETQLPETAAFTVITVARKNQAGGVALVSTLAGSSSSTPYAHQSMRTAAPVRYTSGVKTTPTTAETSLGYDLPAGDSGFEMLMTSCSSTQLTMLLPRNPAGVVGGNPRSIALAGPRDTGGLSLIHI